VGHMLADARFDSEQARDYFKGLWKSEC